MAQESLGPVFEVYVEDGRVVIWDVDITPTCYAQFDSLTAAIDDTLDEINEIRGRIARLRDELEMAENFEGNAQGLLRQLVELRDGSGNSTPSAVRDEPNR